jgi:hypothetical protein
MRQYQYCAHARARLRQRGRCEKDVDLILRYGTPVKGDGVMLLEGDVTRTIRDLKALSDRLQRLANWKVVLVGNEVVTIYRTRRHHQKRLLKS